MPTRSEVQAAAKTLAAARRDKEGITPDKKGSKKKVETQPEPKKSKKGWIIGLCAAVALAGIGVGTYFLVTNLNKGSSPSVAKIQYEQYNGGYRVTGITNQNKSLVKKVTIPNKYNGKDVVEIKAGALGGCAYLEEVTLPFIGKNADATGKEGLFGYVFGKEMSEGAGAYTWQQYLDENNKMQYEQTIIPGSLYKVTINGGNVISPGAFSLCKYISEIHIKNNKATKIGNYAFYYCSSIFDFTIPEGITEIDDYAFSRDYVLQEISIPSKVTRLGVEAFSNDISLAVIRIPASVTTIDSMAFNNLQSALIICEATEKQPGWASDWVSDGISISYGTDSVVYCENALVALCNDSTSNGKYIYLIQWTGEWETGTLNIPDEININGTSYPVKVIGARFFEENINVRTVNIGKNITTIGSYAFSACDKLTTVNFTKDFVKDVKENETLTSIGAYAFANCTSLQGYTNDDEFFDGILLPNKVTDIGNHAFYNCKHITHLRLPNDIVNIGDSAFEGCERLLWGFDSHDMTNAAGDFINHCDEAIRVPRSITTIGKAAFKNCFRLQDDGETSILYPMIFVEDNRDGEGSAGLERYSESVFENCGIYTKTGIYSRQIRIDFDLGYAQDPGVESFDDACFKNAYMYNFVVRNENLQYVGDYAFYACYPNFPNNPVKICHNVWHIGEYAFYNWTTCAGVYFEGTKPGDPAPSLIEIGNSAFRGMNNANFTELVIPDTVRKIGDYAFYGCNKVETLHIPENTEDAEGNPPYTTIGFYTFANMSNLGRTGAPLVIPANVTNLEKYCFQSCTNLKEIRVACDESGNNPQPTIKKVSWNVFYNCTNLNTIKWDLTNCTSFSSSVFYNCTNLTEDATITLGDNYHTINTSTYANCTGLTSVTINKGITSISSSAFVRCSNLETVTFQDDRSANCSIGTYAFKDCTKLKKVTFTDDSITVSTIGEQAFAGCTNLGTTGNDFYLPKRSSVTINKNAFMEWTGNQTIKFYKTNVVSADQNIITDTTKDHIRLFATSGSKMITLDRKDGSQTEFTTESSLIGSKTVKLVYAGE